MSNLKNIILFGIIFIVSGVFAGELELSDLEHSLTGKKQPDCTKTPCPKSSSEVDSLLDKLVHDHAKKGEAIKEKNIKSELEESKEGQPLKMGRAELIVLNKITAKSVRATIALGEVRFFGNLSIEVHKCIKNTDPFDNSNFMLITAFDHKIDDDNVSVFHGWMLSSNPSISTLEHPVYEIFPVNCIPVE
jgi:hypothetical protein